MRTNTVMNNSIIAAQISRKDWSVSACHSEGMEDTFDPKYNGCRRNR